jgi:hypothetical protein
MGVETGENKMVRPIITLTLVAFLSGCQQFDAPTTLRIKSTKHETRANDTHYFVVIAETRTVRYRLSCVEQDSFYPPCLYVHAGEVYHDVNVTYNVMSVKEMKGDQQTFEIEETVAR